MNRSNESFERSFSTSGLASGPERRLTVPGMFAYASSGAYGPQQQLRPASGSRPFRPAPPQAARREPPVQVGHPAERLQHPPDHHWNHDAPDARRVLQQRQSRHDTLAFAVPALDSNYDPVAIGNSQLHNNGFAGHLNSSLTSSPKSPLSPASPLSPGSPPTSADVSGSSEARKPGSRPRSGSQGKSGWTIQRSRDAPITLQGWLHKQGSDGFMLWKKRWFVLSEFCLFYYKSPDEEKCSGSILLPSYKITPATKDDGVTRKCAFKAEHQNMRTYYFAADNEEGMRTWMNALSLASICQPFSPTSFLRSEKNESSSSPLQTNGAISGNGHIRPYDGFVPGPMPAPARPALAAAAVRTPRPIQHHYPPAVHQMFGANGNAFNHVSPRLPPPYLPPFFSPPHAPAPGYHMPPATPAAKRWPEQGPRRSNEAPTGQPVYANAPPKPRRMNGTKDDAEFPDDEEVLDAGVGHNALVTGFYQKPVSRAFHRATPRMFSTNEEEAEQQVPEDIVAGPRVSRSRGPQDRRTPEVYGRAALQMNAFNRPAAGAPAHTGGHAANGCAVPRPKSADFLEYELQHLQNQHWHQMQVSGAPPNTALGGSTANSTRCRTPRRPQPPRPKSSVDQRISRPAFPSCQNECADGDQLSVTAVLDATNKEIQSYFPTPSPRKTAQRPDAPGTASTTYQNVMNSRTNYLLNSRVESVTPNRLDRMDSESSEFRRSSSARLHRNKKNHPDAFDYLQHQGEDHRREQREESMRRLLEWKQRMLQSPLTRKASRNTSRTQTPTNCSSPVPTIFAKIKVQDLTSNGSVCDGKRVTRKGSGASKSSRSRSSPRNTNRVSTSSSDEELQEPKSSESKHRRRANSMSKKDPATINNLSGQQQLMKSMKNPGNLLDLTAQDLLGKSHEELVLMLIHLRRQAAALNEAIEGCRSELQHASNIKGINDLDSDEKSSGSYEQHFRLMQDLKSQLRDLEEKRARGLPLISLVDNMVKLGSLYRGAQDGPLSHRIRNFHTENGAPNRYGSTSGGGPANIILSKEKKADIQRKLEELYYINLAISWEAVVIKYLRHEHQDLLAKSLRLVKKTIGDGDRLDHVDKKELMQQQRNMERELQRVRAQLQVSQLKLEEASSQHARWEHDLLLLRQQLQAAASRDMQFGLGQSAETLNIESELAHVQQEANELHRRRAMLTREVETLTQRQDYLASEIRPSPTGVAGAEPVPSRKKKWTAGWVETDLDSMAPGDQGSEAMDDRANMMTPREAGDEEHNYENFMVQQQSKKSMMEEDMRMMMSSNEVDMSSLSLGDISEADDRVKKFYGIIPRDNKEIKTVRMVKRDSKERRLGQEEDDEATVEADVARIQSQVQLRGSGETLTVLSARSSSCDPIRAAPSEEDKVKTNFKLGEYYRRKYSKDSDRPLNGLSAHERLFGGSRETSLSPPSSPEKSLSDARVSLSSTSPITSPIFKSATAKAIIEEVGKYSSGQPKRKYSKKRSFTITSSHPAVMEALQDHQAKVGSARSRDDLDMEQVLGPRGPNTPDVIRSTLDHKQELLSPPSSGVSQIDNLFGIPDKIVIPERYIPETDMDHQTPEERKVRLKKVDSIRRMLAEQSTSGISGEHSLEADKEERKQREQLLELNHLIAKQVMEKSRMVAGRMHQS